MVAVLLASVCFLSTRCPTDSPGVATAKAFLDALNSRDKATMERFIDQEFVKSQNGRSLSDRADQFMLLANIGLPAVYKDTMVDEPGRVIVRLTSALGFGHELKILFQKDDPHLATALYFGGPGSQSHPDPKKYDNWKDLPDLLSQIKKDTGIPALALAYFDNGKEQSTVVGSRGLQIPAEATLNDRWLLGSITKSMTATMIARLVDQGVLKWTTTVGEALPQTPMRPEYRDVTILQLLHHRAGVVEDSYVNDEFLAKAAGDSPDLATIRDHYAAFILSREPVGKPDEKMVYSNAGYALAAHMAEVVAKKPYETLMRDLVFRPLKMGTAKFGVPGTPGNPGGPGQLMGHTPTENGLKPYVIDDPRLMGIQAAAGAGLSMTVTDLLKFVKYHLAGLRGKATLMSQANFNVLHKPAVDKPGAYKYACGWVIDSGPERVHEHNGTDGTFRAEMAIWPDRNLAIVAISNAGAPYDPSPPLQALRAVFDRLSKR